MLNRGLPTAQSSAAQYHGQTLLPLWQAFTPIQLPKPGNKTEQRRSHPEGVTATGSESVTLGQTLVLEPSTLDRTRRPSTLKSC